MEAGWRNVEVHWVQKRCKELWRRARWKGGKTLLWMLNCTQT